MIPRRFFGLFDCCILTGAFFLTYWLLPRLQPLVLYIQQHKPGWMYFLAIQSDWPGDIPLPGKWMTEMLIIGVTTVLVTEMWNGYGPLLKTSPFRIVFRSIAAPLIGLSVATLVQFALKTYGISRLFLFMSVVCGGLGLMSYRLVLWAYFRQRLRHGFYAKNTVLIGLPSAVEWMTHYFSTEVSASEYHLLGYLSVEPATPGRAHFQVLRLLGKVQALGDILVHQPIHEVVVIQPS